LRSAQGLIDFAEKNSIVIRRRRFFIITILIVLIGIPVALRSFGRPLRLYTSPWVTAYGERVRYQMLIPEGWDVHVPGRWDDRSLPMAGATGLVYFPLSAVPNLSQAGLGAPAERPYILVGHDGKKRNPATSTPPTVSRNSVTYSATWSTHMATAQVTQQGRTYDIEYYRTNEPEFDATYRRICESFRVIR
jgi:hypothetical protein